MSKEFKGSIIDFFKSSMGEKWYKKALDNGLLREEADGSLTAPLRRVE